MMSYIRHCFLHNNASYDTKEQEPVKEKITEKWESFSKQNVNCLPGVVSVGQVFLRQQIF